MTRLDAAYLAVGIAIGLWLGLLLQNVFTTKN